ncbi:MAG: PSD1 and planctomycete cytochrome C domain-containing protein [Fimbriimonadaceae bacterium]
MKALNLRNTKRMRPITLLGASALPLVAALSAPGKPPAPSFAKSVAPVFKAHCIQCHGADSASGGLRLDTPAGILKGGTSGPIFVAGHPGKSLLIKRITQAGPSRMPMGFPALPPTDVKAISTWIGSGAKFDVGMGKHWAYVAPVKEPLPLVRTQAWVRNPIDAFVLARLEKDHLKPSPEASRAVLLRRVCLDITGLPPTEAQQRAFLTDRRFDAYDRLVDSLLASPAYGERMASPWLDLARYADTNGYEKDVERRIWPYRDWVINAFNADMPYDEFTIKQLAGDLLPHPETNDLIATGFNRNTMLNQEGGVDPAEQRWLTLVDRVGTTGSVFLGSTLMCCQCHNHKYDPFTQEEFYKLMAFFQTSDEPTLKLYDSSVDVIARRVAELNKVIAQEKGQTAETQRLKILAGKLSAEVDRAQQNTTLILREKPDSSPPTDYIRIKGSFLHPGKQVIAGTPASLPPMPVGAPLNRLGLAEWITDRNNPLTARVEVNRLWSMVFGIGLVKTEGDFGTQGERPIYKDLLDWLAVDFMDHGWSIKKVLRLIVTSNTYKQSSVQTADMLERDPEDRLLERGARFRMSAEMIRDNALAAAGLLSKKIGGPSVMPDQPDGVWNISYNDAKWITSKGEDRFRRGLYTYWRRTMPYPAFLAFDATSREACTVNRQRTNTPLQALVLLNDPVYQLCARGLAAKMLAIKGDSFQRIAGGFHELLVRQPSPTESSRLAAYLVEQERRIAADPAAATALLGKAGPVAGADAADSAAYLLVATVMLNLDETITKE